MMKCKEAASSDCGRTCCCLYCDLKDTCDIVCESVQCGSVTDGSQCPNAYAEDAALAVLQEKAASVIQAISTLTLEKKRIEDQEKEMKKQLLSAMEQYGVKKLENDSIRITYVAPTTRSTIDSKALKADLPDVAEKYSKVSNVSASIKITVK